MNAEPHEPPAAAYRMVRGLAAAVLMGAVAIAILVALPALRPHDPSPLVRELARSGTAALALASSLLLLSGLAGMGVVAHARCHRPERTGRAARVPQAVIVTLIASAACLVAWRFRPLSPNPAASAAICTALGAGAVVLAFPLLVIERLLAASRMPEALALSALAFVAMAALFAAGLVELAAGAGLPATDRAGDAIAIIVALVGAELAVRALGRLFLPPPRSEEARAACTSSIARLLGATTAQGDRASRLRLSLGIDFSRSWALAYIRTAMPPLIACLALLAWGLSGVVLVPLDERAVYERFGAPVRVLHAGLHVILPWPLGAARRVEFGRVHELPLGDITFKGGPATGAEDPPPATADRLWEQAHPGEITLLVASAGSGSQNFQSVSADLRLLYRIGETDEDALRAAYALADPPALVRAIGGSTITAYFAWHSLAFMLGADREAIAETLRGLVQAQLDHAKSGIDLVAVAIEAIHPPAGAADAYHAVRAAEIAAQAAIAGERGRAIVIRSQSRQYAAEQTANATAAAAETTGQAQAGLLRFAADRNAAHAGGHAFLLERYFASLSAALGKSPMTIIDHRLNWPEAPVLDLRPVPGAAVPIDGKGE